MKIFVCLDDRNGLLFNKRRQSRDEMVLEDIRNSLTGDLTIAPYSEKLIREAGIPYVAAENWDEAREVFLEEKPTDALLNKTHTVVIYRWNRHYPADTRWDIDLSLLGFARTDTREFAGKSHEMITREEYTR